MTLTRHTVRLQRLERRLTPPAPPPIVTSPPAPAWVLPATIAAEEAYLSYIRAHGYKAGDAAMAVAEQVFAAARDEVHQ